MYFLILCCRHFAVWKPPSIAIKFRNWSWFCKNMSTTILKTPSSQKSGSASCFSCPTSWVKFFIALKAVKYSVTGLGRNPTCILGANVFDRSARIPVQEGIMLSFDSGIILCELLIMNSYFSNSFLYVWSKYNSFWTWKDSLSRSFWEEWKEWIFWQSSLLRFGALIRSRESFGGFCICLPHCAWNKVTAVSWACILPDKLFLIALSKLSIAANVKQFLSKWLVEVLDTLNFARLCILLDLFSVLSLLCNWYK